MYVHVGVDGSGINSDFIAQGWVAAGDVGVGGVPYALLLCCSEIPLWVLLHLVLLFLLLLPLFELCEELVYEGPKVST